VSRKKHFQCQIIYVTSQDRKDVVFVIVIFTLRILLVHVALQDLEQNREAKECGNKVDLQWKMCLEATITGT
jgi:hypothetical protein